MLDAMDATISTGQGPKSLKGVMSYPITQVNKAGGWIAASQQVRNNEHARRESRILSSRLNLDLPEGR